MATLNLEPAISTRYRIERVMYRGRCGIETGSHTGLQPILRARLKVLGRCRRTTLGRSTRKCMLLVGVSAPQHQQGVSSFFRVLKSVSKLAFDFIVE